MLKFTLPNANEWHYFYGVNEAFNPLIMVNLPHIAESIFPSITDERLYIVDASIVNAPTCFPENHIIFLGTEGANLYARNVYQFAHELCHIYIKASQKQRQMFWFEETLCEMTSHYFLEVFDKHNIWDSNANSISYLQYSSETLQEIESFNLKSLVQYQSDEINHLIQHPTDRPKNRYVASKLLPIFREHPALFAELPKLANLYGLPDFELLLKAWRDAVAPENLEAVNKVIQVFH